MTPVESRGHFSYYDDASSPRHFKNSPVGFGSNTQTKGFSVGYGREAG